MFFVRSIFWLSVVFVLLPVAPEDQDKIEPISPIEAVGAAAAAVRDISGFCDRNPATCETGGKAAVALGYKAKYGAQQLLTASDEPETIDGGAPLADELAPSFAEVSETVAAITPSADGNIAGQSDVPASSADTGISVEPVVSAEAVVPASAVPATPTPRARPNI